jgi:hypothetical protein
MIDPAIRAGVQVRVSPKHPFFYRGQPDSFVGTVIDVGDSLAVYNPREGVDADPWVIAQNGKPNPNCTVEIV